MTVKVSEADFRNASESYQGWCPDCGEFTRDETEPDAEGYDCPQCENHNVMGADNALMSGLIDLDDAD